MLPLVLGLWMVATTPARGPAPVVGAWELNLGRTHYGPGVERRKRERFTCSQEGSRVDCTIRSVRADGREVVASFRAVLGGAPAPVTGMEGMDAVRLRLDGAVLEATFLLRGAAVFGYRAYQSDDTRSLMIVTVDPAGKALTTVVVYDHR